jgi:hypothetical protein
MVITDGSTGVTRSLRHDGLMNIGVAIPSATLESVITCWQQEATT